MKHNKSIRPPRSAERLFQWYCKNSTIEDLQGDVEELFYQDVRQMSVYRAKLKYWQRTLSLLFSYSVKKRKQRSSFHYLSTNPVHPAMLKNYFVIATRNLSKHKLFTVINIFGMAMGMSIGLLLLALLSFLSRYDNFHANKDNIYRIISLVNDKQRNPEYASAPAPLAGKLKQEYAGVEDVIRINSSFSGDVVNNEKHLPVSGYFVDPEFLNLFSFPLAKGNISTALSKPNTILLTEKAAKRILGTTDVLGKFIQIENFGLFEVTGLLADIPKNSHLQFEALTSYQTLESVGKSILSDEPWKNFSNSYVYFLANKKNDVDRITEYINTAALPMYASEQNFSIRFELQALRDIAPGRELFNQIGPEWGYASLTIFAVLTLLILLPACFNYANISVSRALKRMKEIGIRKVMGGQKDQIFFQFIMETVVITFIALIIAFYIFVLIRAEFLSMLVGGSDIMDLTMNTQTTFLFVIFALVVGLAAGIIPALYFSNIGPIEALKKKVIKKGFSGLSLRKALIISQFALSLGFIMSVVIVLNQYKHTLNYDFGFQQENILDVELQGVNNEAFRNEFEKLSSVQRISMSSHIIGTESGERSWIKTHDKIDSTESSYIYVDEFYLDNLNLQLIAGSNFSAQSSLNENGIIVNEQFVKNFQFKNVHDALGTFFYAPDGKELTIIGVVKDFHYMSLREPIQSFYFRYDPEKFSYANLRISSNDVYGDLSQMESLWKTIGGETKFTAQFFKDEIKDAYAFYFSMIKICGFLGLLAITISCLGLLGMVVLTVENRVKEVGIRKVMGATGTSIAVLLSWDFLKLMIIAAVVATPITYLFFEKLYLANQYYHVSVGVLEIFFSLLIMLLLGLTTVLSQTLKAARSNPVDTLRYE